jgi:type IV pilus assembly protein PilW
VTSPITLRAGRERGFSLVELMIAVTIGLVLTITLAQLFLGSRRTYATTDDVSRMQENIRYTYQLLTRTLHLAGYKSSPNIKTEDVFTADVNKRILDGVDGGIGTASDSFLVRFEGSSNGPGAADNTVFDCLGVPVQAGTMATNNFTIQLDVNGKSGLYCNGSELVPDVRNMQVLYGLDTDRDLVADTFVQGSPALFGNLIQLMSIRTVKVALLFETPNTHAAVTQDTRTHTLLGVDLQPFNDNHIRRVVTLTVNLRNRTP